MAERLNAVDSKSIVSVRVPGVQIPLSPFFYPYKVFWFSGCFFTSIMALRLL